MVCTGARYTQERRGMKVDESKRKYTCVNERETHGNMSMQGAELVKVEEFKCLGSNKHSPATLRVVIKLCKVRQKPEKDTFAFFPSK